MTPQDPTMQLLGWAASRATDAVLDRVVRRAARKVKARVVASAKNRVSKVARIVDRRPR